MNLSPKKALKDFAMVQYLIFPMLAMAILLVGLVHPAAAKKRCSENAVCIESVKNRLSVDLFVINLKAFQVTTTISVTTTNMRVETIKKPTETYPGHSRVHAVRLHVANRQVRWRYRYHYNWIRGSLHAVHDDRVVYDLPYAKGRGYRVAQSYDGKFSHFGDDRYAIDFTMPEGTTVHAAREGVVVGVKENSSSGGPSETFKDQGNYIIVRHADHTLGEYFHLKHNGVLVKLGQSVGRGDPIGLSGDTGYAQGAHLHFGVYGALNGKQRRSFPVRFRTRSGTVRKPVQGKRYYAP